MYFKNLLKYRGVWLGIAMIWILLFHTEMNFNHFLLNNLRSIGYGGVDICFFASGIGCFYSLSSNPDIGKFMKRRFQRIAPTYLVFIAIWLAYQFYLGKFDLRMAIGNTLAIQNFTGLHNDFNWYITALLLLYLLTPYFKLVIDRTNLWGKLGFLILLIVISIPFWGVTNYIITITRLPIYYIGMLFGYLCQKDIKVRLSHCFIFGLAFVTGIICLMLSCKYYFSFLWSHGLYWYPFILITPPLCMLISYLMSILEKNKITQKFVALLSCIGDYSFEIYLLHIPLVEIIRIIIARNGLSEDGYIHWILAIVPLIVACFVLRKTVKLLEKYIIK